MSITHDTFCTALLDPSQPVPAGLINGKGAAAGNRFDVYRNNVAVGLTDALIAGFPVIHQIVGDAFFKAMAGVYLRTHLPRSPVMARFGDQLPLFLRRFGPAQGLPYLPDMARLEIALRQSYHAADAPALGPAALAEMTPEVLMAARLRLAPAVTVVRSSYPIHGIYCFNTAGGPQPSNRPETVLVTRPDFDCELHLISTAQADFIAALMAGDRLGVAVAQLGQHPDMTAVLGLLFRQGALTQIN